MESVREFRVEANAYSAEFGRNLRRADQRADQVGQQRLRGSAFEYHRNDALDAKNYFDTAGKPDFHRNQFGGDASAARFSATACSSSLTTKR